jgi:hypothetical protein
MQGTHNEIQFLETKRTINKINRRRERKIDIWDLSFCDLTRPLNILPAFEINFNQREIWGQRPHIYFVSRPRLVFFFVRQHIRTEPLASP